ncbi:MAG: aldo/keto reductase [Thermoanaerobaculales bacterium]|jgi:predicted aldo/keto reductase-like oxidoreductase|nr:aldo/keto reductase [Thermoanaerobaculales bacterium]
MTDSKKTDSTIERRDVLKLGTAAAAGFVAKSVMGGEAKSTPALPNNPRTPKAMPTRNLGKTGYQVGIFSLGGQSAIEKADNFDVAVPLINRALDLGINYVDTSARYGGTEHRWSEQYFGEVMKTRRSETYLATKSHDRTRDGSLKLLERSLKLLNTDHIDLWQMHALSRMEQVEESFAPGGAIEAFVEARDQGIVRHLGVSGHADPDVLIAAIERFDFDCILLAVNAADPHHLSFKEKLLPLAVEKEMGIIGMKIPSRGLLLKSWKAPDDPKSRYAGTVPGTLDMTEAMRYVLTLPVSTVIVGCDDIPQLEENVEIARSFNPMSEPQLLELEERAKPIHEQVLFYRSWKG